MTNLQLPLEQKIITVLSRLQFATRDQIAYWCETKPITVFVRLTALEKQGLVASDKANKPNIWRVKNIAAKIMQTTVPSGGRPASWSVMAHACHRNEVEILLARKKESAGFRFLDRVYLWKRGLNPGHGEHAGVDAAKQAYLVLIDDYYMKPERIAHTWERVHHPPKKVFAGNRALTWSKIVHKFIVVSNDAFRAEQHAAWIKKHKIPATVMTIKNLWR